MESHVIDVLASKHLKPSLMESHVTESNLVATGMASFEISFKEEGARAVVALPCTATVMLRTAEFIGYVRRDGDDGARKFYYTVWCHVAACVLSIVSIYLGYMERGGDWRRSFLALDNVVTFFKAALAQAAGFGMIGPGLRSMLSERTLPAMPLKFSVALIYVLAHLLLSVRWFCRIWRNRNVRKVEPATSEWDVDYGPLLHQTVVRGICAGSIVLDSMSVFAYALLLGLAEEVNHQLRRVYVHLEEHEYPSARREYNNFVSHCRACKKIYRFMVEPSVACCLMNISVYISFEIHQIRSHKENANMMLWTVWSVVLFLFLTLPVTRVPVSHSRVLALAAERACGSDGHDYDLRGMISAMHLYKDKGGFKLFGRMVTRGKILVYLTVCSFLVNEVRKVTSRSARAGRS